MTENEREIVELLGQIRDLLIPISSHYQPEYEEKQRQLREGLKDVLRQLAVGNRSRESCALMDGSRSQSEISQTTGIDKGNLSRLVSRLHNEGLLTTDSDNRKPKLIFAQDELTGIFGGD